MGGYNSGRPGWRAKCEHRLSIDVRRWAKERYLTEGRYFGWRWTINDNQTSSISVESHAHHIELSYTKDEEKFCYSVRLTRTPCHLGGQRVWFLCPNIHCQRRVAKLYLSSQYFLCRHCLRLIYQSQCEDAVTRLWRKQRKLEAKLADGGGKPKGMHSQTFERICEQIAAAEIAKDEVFVRNLLRRFQAEP